MPVLFRGLGQCRVRGVCPVSQVCLGRGIPGESVAFRGPGRCRAGESVEALVGEWASALVRGLVRAWERRVPGWFRVLVRFRERARPLGLESGPVPEPYRALEPALAGVS
ncbi:hypothetical protein GCM10022223_70060 [Kineosporia mesophila]|uniref:Uncharacterized protein n=1 Tax=Kineosporia mesophila TaxID=566012 RepID=A0ABP7AUA7_9ACTN